MPHLVVLKAYTWFYIQESFLEGFREHISAGNRTHIGEVQGIHPTQCTIAPSPILGILKFSILVSVSIETNPDCSLLEMRNELY